MRAPTADRSRALPALPLLCGPSLSADVRSVLGGFLPSYGHPDVDLIENLSAAIVVDQKRLGGGSRSTVGTITDIAPLLRLLFSRAGQPYVGYANAFSFNDPQGMCPDCHRRRQGAPRVAGR